MIVRKTKAEVAAMSQSAANYAIIMLMDDILDALNGVGEP